MGDSEDVSREINYRIGRGEMKYEVFQILKENREKADPEIKELVNNILTAVELEIQKL